MSEAALIVHGHFYQPPRENPWTEEVPRESSAAPFHDWNERIALESYRPNAFARILDDHGRVVSIVNNYRHLSWDFGPTLLSWLERGAPEAYQRLIEADADAKGGMAQAFFHVILPLAREDDIRTQVRWGMREFSHRFGRRADGIWLPETAVNDTVLRVLAQEGVRFTVLAPGQAARVRPLSDGVAAVANATVQDELELDEHGGAAWIDVSNGSVDTRKTYRWIDPDSGLGVDVIFYDGGLSHAAAFGLGGLSSEDLVHQARDAAGGEGVVTLAADGETFGHHHTFGDRLLAYALEVVAPQEGLEVTTPAAWLDRHPPRHQVQVHESAWSCAHGVGRWREDCGCSTGGLPGWNQAWREPLRRALDVVSDAVCDVFDRRAPSVLRDPAAAVDDYVDVLIGATTKEAFSSHHVTGDAVEAFTLLEADRHRMAMYTSCGWFFNDLAGLETVQVLRYAGRALDCLSELDERAPVDEFLSVLGEAWSNVQEEGNGRDIWFRHVAPVRVDADRVVAHLALGELLDERPADSPVAAFDTEVIDHDHHDRGALALASGTVRVTHRRTGRTSVHTYAALHLGGLEVLGAARAADAERDDDDLKTVRTAFADGAPVTTLLRVISDRFGPAEFGLASALPDKAEHILRRVGRSLVDRFGAAYERLYGDHRETLHALMSAGYPMPAELRMPAEMALARRLDAEVAAQAGSLDPADYATAISVAREARSVGFSIDTPRSQWIVERLLVAAVEAAVREDAGGDRGENDTTAVDNAITALAVVRELGLTPSLERAQELVYDALGQGRGSENLRRLGAALGLAV